MGNLFTGLTSGSAALSYYQRGIETAGHNIANAGTAGYARQRVDVSAKVPVGDGGVLIGQGVSVDSITRIRSAFLDAMYRTQLPSLGYYEVRVNALANLEYYVGPYDRNTFQNALDVFWSDMGSLSEDPNESAARESLLGSTQTMMASLTNMKRQYDLFRTDLNDEIRSMVSEANHLIDDIAVLCKEISSARNKGENPNDLFDKRDRLAERLCKLTGAAVGSPSLDEADGDYKIDLNGKILVQGGAQYGSNGTDIRNTRHLILVPMAGNNGYYDVQVEHNLYDHISDLSVASVIVERGASDPAPGCDNGLHEFYVERLANGMTWTVGGALGQVSGGERIDMIYSQDQALGIDGSFCLQVGTAGVRVTSRAYGDTDPPGVIRPAPEGEEPIEYEFRIAAGEFETYVNVRYDKGLDEWRITTDNGGTTLGTEKGALTSRGLRKALAQYPQLAASFDADSQSFSIEGSNTGDMRGHLLSITDTRGSLAADMGIANKNPAVEITVTTDDTLRTIANKINAAYQSGLVAGDNPAYATNPPGVAPARPEEWLHANVIREPNGSYYIALTSDVSGEANRINVLPGSVCGAGGDFSAARLLGFADGGDAPRTSYMQLITDPAAASTINREGVYVNDAYFIFDGRHYLSESNSFAQARLFKTTDAFGGVLRWDNPGAGELGRFSAGIRLNLAGLNRYYDEDGLLLSGNPPTRIIVRPHVTNGEIYAMLESRDDTTLGFEDYLDQIAWELITEVNALHYSGHGNGNNLETTGVAFFGHVGGRYGASGSLYLNDALEKDASLIAAGSGDGNGFSRGCGDGSTALLMAQLKSSKLFASGTADFSKFFQQFVADVGTQGYKASYMLETHRSVADQIEGQRESVMGVNSDEEMLDIIRFQQGVGGISRYMTAIDDMLDRLINGMGRVGI